MLEHQPERSVVIGMIQCNCIHDTLDSQGKAGYPAKLALSHEDFEIVMALLTF